MKYWRGLLVAAIIAAITYGINLLASQYTTLVDMFYPYVTRTVMNFLAEWSIGVNFCLWQVALVVLLVLVMVSIVLMIILRWNPIQWFGWVAAVVALIYCGNVCIYGLNQHAGPIADDIRLNVTEYTLEELESATVYYRDLANDFADQIDRDAYPNFDELAVMAADGFKTLTYEHSYSVFAGTRVPVKKLGWADLYSSMGITGVTVGLTGEAAVHPDLPEVGLPFAMCHEMAHRMCIANDSDADFAAYLACANNSGKEFQYSAYFMAYRYCYNALASQGSVEASNAAARILTGTNKNLKQDLMTYNGFFDEDLADDATACLKISSSESASDYFGEVADLLVSWHIQEIVLPAQQEDAESVFDPYDESQVDLTDIVGALKNQKEEEAADKESTEEASEQNEKAED